MDKTVFYIAGGSPALKYAGEYLEDRGRAVATAPGSDVTHLLLPVPFYDSGGQLRDLLAALPKDITVLGGKLSHPALEGYRTVDLLEDAYYLAENAAITADCALRIAGSNMGVVFRGCPVLILGWGRIGKCLAGMLKALGAEVTVAARKKDSRAMAQALGFHAEDIAELNYTLARYRVIFSTVPAAVLTRSQLTHCRKDCIKIDLASTPGIEGSDVIWARGLPGKDTPESSGVLIGKTVLQLTAKEGAK